MSETVVLVALLCVTMSAFAAIFGVSFIAWKILELASNRSADEPSTVPVQQRQEDQQLTYGMPDYSEEVGYSE